MSFHSSKAYHVAIVVSDLEAPHHMTDLSWVAEISSVKVKLDGSHPHPPAYILMDWLVILSPQRRVLWVLGSQFGWKCEVFQ